MSSKYKIPIIVSTHPRLRKKLKNKSNKKLYFISRFHLQIMQASKRSNLLFQIVVQLMRSSILKFNAINLREAHERPESEENCVTIMSVQI